MENKINASKYKNVIYNFTNLFFNNLENIKNA